MRASEDEDDEKGEAEEEEEDEMEEEDPWRGVEAATMVACASNRLRWLRAAADRPPRPPMLLPLLLLLLHGTPEAM